MNINKTNLILDDISVDCFTYNTKYRFLSHAHADHTNGLHQNYNYPIITSETTKKHITTKFGISAYTVLSFPTNEWIFFDSDIKFILLDANHSFGAVMFYIEYKKKKIFHTGDFRYSPNVHSPSLFASLKIPYKSIDILYLDTTYLHRRFNHPPQNIVLNDLIKEIKVHKTEKMLIMVGSYTIGKEKVFRKIIENFNFKNVYCTERVRKYLPIYFHFLNNETEQEVKIAEQKKDAKLHIVDLKDVQIEPMKYYTKNIKNEFKTVIGIVPTGFALSMKIQKHYENGIKFVTIKCPYSEHSSYDELRKFCKIVKANKIIPTVNYNVLMKNNELEKRLFKKGFQQKIDCFIVKKRK